MVLDCGTWHNTNMPCAILEFGQNEFKYTMKEKNRHPSGHQ
jgi:hypothetical protein